MWILGRLISRAGEDAQALQDEARAAARFIMWFVSTTDADHPGPVAWAIMADAHGGTRRPGMLAADTMAEPRAMLRPD